MKEPLPYASFRPCTKCGFPHYGETMPAIKYDPDKQLLKRTCWRCKYHWWEYPKDHEDG